ncbi:MULTISPECIES: YhcN/YlaJ family sporulation lipoprotein [Thermoactinomyces]|jgi:YhcN/YlaJ family sporulation lipoprotein|uniref:YhcN/YlaJ family sporulation lipoprotein n=1 Tax=Thermoactinomyces daqus TaxID=1329516 RepID=A0A7W1X9K7_9BACL|nr:MULTISPECIES: YhcN/YlaJ family sporulation lipoprotein [Thermoactinomyces]MBA4542571.1 YhcN/YlaJ family sporulation lipoprotein [Thermoactinomyces daqus]MBH8598029.1 YhcN/YlaJ family sporulation lipoprotein [Thermoactinomyces sp. CICC 10523]MBH8607133.1 YhcN/YlaJ family sporulation lipoprotein [Thermoactinomyces sp. CICC 10521]
MTWKLKWIGLLAALLVLTGCQQENKPPANQSAPPSGKKIPQTVEVKQTAPEPKRDQSPQAKADRLAQLAMQVPNVKSASAVVMGKYTLVGIALDPTLDRGRVGTIKYTVAQALKEDPLGANALVTADPALTQRIRELSEHIRQGHPVGGLMNELAEIANRIAPQPSRETERTEQAPNKMNQERLNQSRQAPAR